MITSILFKIFPLLGIPAAAAAPSTRDGSMVVTPGGLRDASKVHQVPAGGEVRRVRDDIHLLDASGNIIQVVPNTAPTGTTPPPAFIQGWTAYTSWDNTASNAPPISSFNSTWQVPPAPASNDGQIVYLFNGLMPVKGGEILQPVLQWGVTPAGGGPFWAIASWWVTDTSAFHSALVPVNETDVLVGSMTLTEITGSAYTYNSVFEEIEATSFSVGNVSAYVWATETLECYNIVQSSDYPAGETEFSNIYIETMKGTPTFKWDIVQDTANGITVHVAIDGGTSGEVVITY